MGSKVKSPSQNPSPGGHEGPREVRPGAAVPPACAWHLTLGNRHPPTGSHAQPTRAHVCTPSQPCVSTRANVHEHMHAPGCARARGTGLCVGVYMCPRVQMQVHAYPQQQWEQEPRLVKATHRWRETDKAHGHHTRDTHVGKTCAGVCGYRHVCTCTCTYVCRCAR